MFCLFRSGFRKAGKLIILEHNHMTRHRANYSKINDKLLTFDNFFDTRRQEASRSIIVQVSSEKSFPELYNYCSSFGNIIGAHHYKVSHEDLHYILIEFENENLAKEALSATTYNEDLSGVPVRSPFLWFKAANAKLSKIIESPPENVLKCLNGIDQMNNTEISDLLQAAESLDDQIKILYESTKLSDLGIRLRFLAAKQIETSISGMFPYANAAPFGSSVNGFGKMGSDLDLILRFDDENRKKNKHDSRLVFHTKENLTNGRSQTQRQMENIGDMLHLFLPGVSHVRRILQARVPIIKYNHEHLNLEVDLSMSNLTGMYMSELFYIFGQIDERVRPLIFCLRKWAHTVGLTNPSPGRWITNFSLSCLIIFFLQQLKNPLLPSINFLIKAATPKDVRVTEDGINCTFLRDCTKLEFQSKNESSLSELLLQFFELYSQFDFNNKAISLNEARSVTKPDHSAIYVINPLEQVLNVSKNISLEECERFRIEVRNAAWILESEMDSNIMPDEKIKNEWGLLNLFKNSEKAVIRPNMFFKSRMVEVKELFAENENKSEYKNNAIRNQIQSIRSKNKKELKQIRLNSATIESSEILNKGRRR